jgi:uncharacterized protein (DUF169 family)
MDLAELASRVQSGLGLDYPPVALTFVDTPPADLPGPPRVAPSACTFWREAEKGTFYASAAEHYNCPIGSMVMGFQLPAEVQQQLGELVGIMCEGSYLSADEPARIPAVAKPSVGIVYGPLAQSAAMPDVVLIWVTAKQAMLCNEAMGTASWTAGPPKTTGRPGCAALPLAMAEGSPTMSLGCVGMRTFTGIDDRMLIAIPGSQLASFVDALSGTLRANSQMLGFYEAHRDAVAAR